MAVTYKVNGKEMTPEEFRAGGGKIHELAEGTVALDSLKAWPVHSDALGVHPTQVKDAVAFYKSKGVHVEFDRACRLIMRDRAHRNEVLRASGFHDRNAGYGDRAPD
jgi:hypothetical protein